MHQVEAEKYKQSLVAAKEEHDCQIARYKKKIKQLQNTIDVYNPAKTNATLPSATPYEGYLKVSLALLSLCDGDEVYMLDGWEDSKGSKLEYAYAVAMGKKILREK